MESIQTSLPVYYFDHSRQEMLEFIPTSAKRILDVGCGAGGFIKALKERNPAECWGVELNPQAATQAAKIADKVLSGDIHLQLQALPEGFFDCIVFNDVLEHIIEPFDLLDQLRSKLSSSGILIASIPNVRYIKNLYHLLVQKDWQYQNEGILDKTHLRFFTKRSMLRSLAKNGWKVQSCKGVHPVRFKVAFAILNALTLGSLADSKFMNYAFVFTSARPTL